MRHNEIKDELCDLLSKALDPSAVWDKPIIYPSHQDTSIHLSMTTMEIFLYMAFGPAERIALSMFE
jgi:hypothetical protein